MLETNLSPCWVEGELSNVTYASSGHVYCTLKDFSSQIKCAVWRSSVKKIPFRFENGKKVIVFGSVQVYEPRGEYQLIIDQALSAGQGILQLQFEALKNKLFLEGLFDESRKKELPQYPKRIGIITSPTGAAIEDMLKIFNQQWLLSEIILAGVKVQGEGSAEEIAKAIQKMNYYFSSNSNQEQKIDVIILGRGGGSLEDLWSFNEEIVVRAIANSTIPIVSAIGHEIDYTLSDFAADVRAPTPTAAAQLVVPDRNGIMVWLGTVKEKLSYQMSTKLKHEREKLQQLSQRGSFTRPLDRVYLLIQRIDDYDHRVRHSIKKILIESETKLEHINLRIHALYPLRLLSRGFSIVYNEQKKIVSSVKQLTINDELKIKLSDGSFLSKCTQINENE